MRVTLWAAAIVAAGMTAGAGAVTLTVSATANPWLAGMPAGSTAFDLDVAPANSPAPVVGLPLNFGNVLRFSATGLTDHCDEGGRCGLAGPEGDPNEDTAYHWAGAENGMANVLAPVDSLIGVFLDAAQPSLSPAPGFLDFSTLASRDFASLSPLLKQPFFVGDGFQNDGTTVQSFFVPSGATRLFLGTMDGFGWYNNTGSLTVTVTEAPAPVPEPATVTLAALGLTALGFTRRRRK